MLFTLLPQQLLPRDQAGLPEPIAAANERAHKARDRRDAEQARYSELSEQAKAAPNFDRLAAEAAMAADEPTPKPTTAAKQQKADDARRAMDAAESVAKVRTRELYDAVEDNYQAFLEFCREAHPAAIERVTVALEALRAAIPELERTSLQLACAESWHNNPASADLSAPAGGNPDVFQRRYDKALARDAARVQANSPVVERTPPVLLAALTHALGVE